MLDRWSPYDLEGDLETLVKRLDIFSSYVGKRYEKIRLSIDESYYICFHGLRRESPAEQTKREQRETKQKARDAKCRAKIRAKMAAREFKEYERLQKEYGSLAKKPDGPEKAPAPRKRRMGHRDS